MVNNEYTQYSHNSVSPQEQHAEEVTTVRGVRQDKSAKKFARIASPQPASVEKVMRSHTYGNKKSPFTK